MADTPTIVVAHLDDEKLKASIQSLVTTINTAMDSIKAKTTNTVAEMQRSLQTLGNIKVSSVGSDDGGASRRKKAQEEETQSVKQTIATRKELNATLDQQAAAMQKSIRPTSAQDSYYAIIKNMRENVALLAMEIKSMPSMSLDKQFSVYMQYERQIEQVRSRIAELRQELNNVGKDPNGSRLVVKQITDEIAASQQRIVQLEREQIQATQQIANADKQSLEAKTAQYEREKQELIQMSAGERERVSFIRQQTNELDKQLRKINEISTSKSAKTIFENISSSPTDTLQQAKEKLNMLLALKEKVANTPLMSKSNQSALEQLIETTKAKIEQLSFSERGFNQSKESVEALNAAISQNIAKEQQRREEIMRTGQAARESANAIIKSAYNQASVEGNSAISGVNELRQAVQQMRMAYFSMSGTERKSAIGLALEADIKRANEAIIVIEKYNRSLYEQQGKNNHDITNASSLNSLNNSLKELTERYKKLTAAEINAGKGDELIQKFQDISRAATVLRKNLSTPINFDSINGFNARTLDDMAYKMQMLKSYKQSIDLTKPNAANEIKQVDEAISKLQKDMDKYLVKSKEVLNSNNALGRSWNYMKNRLAFYFTVGASTQFVRNLIEVRSQYEMNERALGILINSAERGTQIFNELSQMALVSPYTLIELSAAAKQLTAYDIAARDVVDTTRRLADMASAVGIPIERLTYALGQIKAYGYLNSRDARMFANAGIPLVKQLSEYYTELEGRLVSTADIYDKIKKKAIGYNDVMQVMTRMTDEGGKFFDFQAKMADTLKVRLANLTLAWNNMLNDIGKETQGFLTFGINALKELFLHWREFDKLIKDTAQIAGFIVALRTLSFVVNRVGLAMGATWGKMALGEIAGARFATVIKGIAAALRGLLSTTGIVAIISLGFIQAAQAIWGTNEAQKALNESIRKGAKDNYDNITKFLAQYKELRESLYTTQKVAIGNIYDPSTKEAIGTAYAEKTIGKNIGNNEAEKAWEAVREQIELTTQQSDQYIGKLLTIANVSERLRQGFALLEDIQIVNAALQEISDDTIKVEKDMSAWWNAYTLPDGLIGNLKDLQNVLNDISDKYGDVGKMREQAFAGGKGSHDLNEYQNALENFREDLKVTTDSIINFISLKGWSGDVGKINEVFNQITQKLILDNQLDPQKAYTLQVEVEEARSAAAKAALEKRIQDEKAALKVAYDADIEQAIQRDITELANWDSYNGRKRVEWERFSKWMKEQHISEATAMFRGMDDEQIRSINFQEGKYGDFVNRMVTKYAKEHKMSYDEAFNYLRSWVRDANQWSIFIKLNIGTGDDKSIYDILSEADSAADTAYKKIERLRRRQKELEAKGTSKTFEEYQESAKITKELTDAQEEYNDALEKGGHSQKEEKKDAKDAAQSRRDAAKAQRDAETELQKALKDELQLIDKVRSQYEKLSKAGVDNTTALNMVTNQFESSISHINSILGKNGLPLFDISKFAGTDNPNAILAMLKSQLDAAKGAKNIKSSEIKDLEVKFSEITVDAKVYNTKKISEGLNNELGKLKEEYELAIEMDATPELSNVFADMMGLDQSELRELPRTFNQVVRKLQTGIDKMFADNGMTSDFDLVNMLDKGDFESWVSAQGKRLDSEFVKSLNSIREYANKVRLDEAKETTKNWAELVSKYGDLQNRILGIYKETINEQLSIIQKFGDDVQKNHAIDLASQIKITSDPQQIARLQSELAKVLSQVTSGNSTAASVANATFKMQDSKIAAATWDDFKNSDLYTMTFEDMSNNSTHAIQLIIDKLETLKNQVKEDPASMKALIKSLEDAENELTARDPFRGLANSLKDMAAASQEAKLAQQELEAANKKVDEAQRAVDESEDGTPQAQADARQRLAQAIQEQTAAQAKLTQAENKGKKSSEKARKSLQSMANQLQDVSGLLGSVSQIFKMAGDEDTSEAIDAINEGFSMMVTIIMAVDAAIKIVTSSNPYLLAIAAALSIIVGLVNFLSGNKNKKITKQVEESEQAVKRLEIAYVDLQHAIDNAYGTSIVGAKQAALANKQLQLEEIRRQILLEKSRDSKDRDDDKILDLQKEYKELLYEIQDGFKEIVNDLMGTDVASFAEDLVSSMVDAFREGEDYMKVFSDKFDEMIDNMIMKSIVSRVVGQYMDRLWEDIDQRITSRSKKEADAYAKAQEENSSMKNMSDDEVLAHMGYDQYQILVLRNKYNDRYKQLVEDYRKAAADAEQSTKQALDTVSAINDSDISWVIEQLSQTTPELAERLKEMISQYYTFGDKAAEDGNQLSALQQGIQGVTEETAGALEAYMNSVSQQVYLHSDLLTQIRDAVVGFDLDVQTATVSQILLQLQNSYQVQMSIQSTLNGWSNPNGMAVRVEMVS